MKLKIYRHTVWYLVNICLDPLNQSKETLFFLFFPEGFTSVPTALTANDRNRRIQVYQASDGQGGGGLNDLREDTMITKWEFGKSERTHPPPPT